MPTKTIQYTPPEPSPNQHRRFEIHFASEPEGYPAYVEELLPGGERRKVYLPYGPQLELHPSSFFGMRQHNRGVFIADIRAAIRFGVVDSRELESDQAEPALFLKANTVGWPAGYPEAKPDDMSDWHDD